MESTSSCTLTAVAPDHALGQYKAWRLGSPLAAALDLAWISVAHAQAPASHRLLPHGEPSIAVLRRRDRQGGVAAVKLTICGPYYRARHYHPQPREELIGFRVMPELSAALFSIAPQDYADASITDAPSALNAACTDTLQLAEYAKTNEVHASLAADLARFIHAREISAGPEAVAARWMRKTEGRIRFRDIADKLEVSERNLRRRFTAHIGCAPKTYARQLQITAAALAAEEEVDPDWAAIAADAGFHDQPHMINAFQAEVGLTPSAFHAERRALKQTA